LGTEKGNWMSALANLGLNLNRVSRLALLLGAALVATQVTYGQLSVTLNTSLPSPQPVGQSIVLTATVTNPSSTLRYRFMVQPPGATTFNMLADYRATDALRWSALQEGTYQFQIDVVDAMTGDTGSTVVSFDFTSRITGGSPVVSPSSHPLVAIYSAPPCAAGTIQVVYHLTTETIYFYSNVLPCQPGLNANFYIGGMRAQASYTMRQRVVNNGIVTWGPRLTFQTGIVKVALPAASISVPFGPATSHREGILLQSYIGLTPGQGFGGTAYPPTAYNLGGQVTWYYPTSHPKGTYLTRPVAGGTFLLYVWDHTADVTVVREVDLQGDLVRETNVYAINQQLAFLQLPTINWLSHEAMRLANGHTLVLGMTERILTDVQGPGAVDVVGDMIIDLDQNLQVAWTWNTFDHLSNSRAPILGEVCVNDVAPCGPLNLAPTANDWTHCNSLYLLPDGNLVLSVRNQDWVVKINYQNGTGDGQILWTLGNLAEQAGTPYFTLAGGGSDPWPWFSHQHDVEFDGTNYELLDNGNTRISPPPVGVGSGHSRGQVYSLDETAMVATRLLSADLGKYSGGFGSAQLLANGDYWFGLGALSNNGAALDISKEVVTDNPLTLSYDISFPSSAYRTFRLASFYSYTN
jgi:arylsulfate sulfotransferase